MQAKGTALYLSMKPGRKDNGKSAPDEGRGFAMKEWEFSALLRRPAIECRLVTLSFSRREKDRESRRV